MHTVEGRQEVRRGGRDCQGLKGLTRSESMKVIPKMRKEYGRSEGREFGKNA